MFIDKNNGNQNQKTSLEFEQGNKRNIARILMDNKYLIYVLPIILISAISAIIFLSINKLDDNIVTKEQQKERGQYFSDDLIKEPGSGLPSAEDIDTISGNSITGTSTDFVQAEYLTFGDFYKKEDVDFETHISKFALPIKTKTDVANYHYVNRKINLDKYINNLDENGFIIIDNPYKKNVNDFYGMYDFLEENGFPILVTSDFTVYFFQNIIKQVYKDIEKDFFYDIFFETNKKLFNIANERYRAGMIELGMVNDPVLEGKRLEAVFFAVALELLKPDEEQTSSTHDSSKFSVQEAGEFNFFLPEYLSAQVKKEVNLIKAADQKIKSPSTFNMTDYRIFKVPNEYKKSAKLNNFYLALKWMNTVFPLHYKSENCENCFIDKDDWLINFIASSFLAKDFSSSREIKNHWAEIYKIISYFSGLKSELTYLYYNNAYTKLFGDDYNIEEIFSSGSPDRDENILKIREELSKYSFLDIEGGYSRNVEYAKPILGLRVLTEPYWPSDYIFNQLISPFVNNYKGGQISELNKTYCVQNGGVFYRCKGFGGDIINLIHTIKNKNSFYSENINYAGYEEQLSKIREKLNDFNINSWYNNNFWSTLSMLKFMLNSELDKPSFAQSDAWEDKEINTALGSWVNFQLPADMFILKPRKNFIGFKTASDCNKYNYIEPNLELIRELKANSKMLYDMLDALGISSEVTSIKYKFENINLHLSGIEKTIIKELQDKPLDNEDCSFIDSIINQYIVEDSGKNDIKIYFNSTGKETKKSVDGVKLMIAVNKYGNEKILIFAPIFNYQE